MPAPTILVVEARGVVPLPDPGVDSRVLAMGCSSAGALLTPSLLYGNPTPLATDYGVGPMVSALGHTLERNRIPGAALRLAANTPGSSGAVDVSGVLGTAVITLDATSAPLEGYEPQIAFLDPGVVGTAGATFQTSLDGGRHWSRKIRLGTADSYMVPTASGAASGVRWLFGPAPTDVTALNTLLNQIKTKLNAHVILTTGTVHTSADSGDVIATANASDGPTRVALANALRVAYEAHRVKGTGASIHINAGGDIVNVIAAPVATDDESSLSLALDLKAKLNLHEAGTTWHTVADATNVVTSPAPSPGTLLAGDLAKAVTKGPQWTNADFATAFTNIATSSLDPGLIYVAGAVAKADAQVLSAGLDVLKAVGKRCAIICHTRRQGSSDPAETEAAWAASIEADFDGFSDSRICVCAGTAFVIDPVSGYEFNRTFAPAVLARVVGIAVSQSPSFVGDGPLEGVRLTDDQGTLIGHDEGPGGLITGLDDSRLSVLQRLPDPARRASAYLCHARVMQALGERIFSLPARRVANSMERDAASVAFDELGGKSFYDPATNTISDADCEAIAKTIREPLSRSFADDIQNPNDDDLVTVNPTVTLDGDDVFIAVSLNPLFFKYKGKITLTLAVQV